MYNVLIVDDEKSVCEGLSVIIDWEKYGFKVLNTAVNGKDALEKLQYDRYNLVITDIRMPVLNGLELIKAIRVQNPNINVLIISGYSNFSYAKQAIVYGVKGYLLKPIDRDYLTQHVLDIKEKLDSELTNKKIIKEIMNIAVDKLLLDFVSGSLAEKKFFEQMMKQGIPMEGSCFNVALIEIEDFLSRVERDLEEANLIKFSVRNIVEEIVQQEQVGIVYEDVCGTLGILFYGEQFELKCKDIEIVLEFIHSSIEKFIKLKINIGFGSTVKTAIQLKECRKQAMSVLERTRIQPDSKDSSSHLMNQIKKYIDNNYSDDLSLKSIASFFYMSPAYLGRIFKNMIGETFSDYLNKIRIAEAKKLILTEESKVYEIILKVGYNNPEHFYRQFKRYEGISLADYKRNVRK